MNKAKLLNEFYITYNSDDYLAKADEFLQNTDNLETGLTELKKAIENEKNTFESLKSQLQGVLSMFDLPTKVGLSSQIDAVINDLGNAETAIDKFLSGSKDNIDGLEKSMNNLNYSIEVFNDIFYNAYRNFKETLYFSFLTKSITLEDLEEMKNANNITDEQKDDINQVMERIKVQLGPAHVYDENMAEQTAVKDEKGKETSNSVVEDGQVIEQPKPMSLSDRINSIEYSRDVNYAEEVTEVRLETELKSLEAQISKLQEKDKLSFSEAIRLQTLLNQSFELEEMMFNLNRGQVKRETKMSNIDSKISLNAERLRAEQESEKLAKSGLFRYVSARKQEKLQSKLAKLKEQMAVIQTEQRMSTLVRFDKINNKLERKAKRQATRQVIMTTTKENVEKLKAFGKKVINGGKAALTEGKNIANDITRFVRNSALMEKLRGCDIVMEGSPSLLELPEVEETLVAHM